MNKKDFKEKHLPRFAYEGFSDFEKDVDALTNLVKEECAKKFKDYLGSDDFRKGIIKILDKY